MFQVVAYTCQKCGCDITPGQEITLQKIDRNNRKLIGNVLTPTLEREFTLCTKCYDEFIKGLQIPLEKYKLAGVEDE